MEHEAKPNSQRSYNACRTRHPEGPCDYIDADLESPLTLEELGSAVQYSPVHLARRFRQQRARPSTSTLPAAGSPRRTL